MISLTNLLTLHFNFCFFPDKASTAAEIIKAAEPFFDDGAIKMMIDSDHFDALGSKSEDEINKILNQFIPFKTRTKIKFYAN